MRRKLHENSRYSRMVQHKININFNKIIYLPYLYIYIYNTYRAYDMLFDGERKRISHNKRRQLRCYCVHNTGHVRLFTRNYLVMKTRRETVIRCMRMFTTLNISKILHVVQMYGASIVSIIICREDKSIKEILVTGNFFCTSEDKIDIIVRRKELWPSSVLAITRENFAWTKTPRIHFSGEDAEDEGGPRREFFT